MSTAPSWGADGDTLRRVTAEEQRDGALGTGVRAEYDFVPVRSDYVELLRNAPMTRAAVVLAWFMFGVLALAVLMRFYLVDADGDPALDPGTLQIMLLLGVPAGLVTLGYARLGGLLAWRRPANREPVRAALDADGVGHTGPSGQQFAVWAIVSRARETAEAYYLYVPNGLGALVYWLPKRAVPLVEQARVAQQIRAHVARYQTR